MYSFFIFWLETISRYSLTLIQIRAIRFCTPRTTVQLLIAILKHWIWTLRTWPLFFFFLKDFPRNLYYFLRGRCFLECLQLLSGGFHENPWGTEKRDSAPAWNLPISQLPLKILRRVWSSRSLTLEKLVGLLAGSHLLKI